VLVVDDNIALAENIKEILEEDGALAEVACDGPDAISRLEESTFDLVITDVRMPGMDGIDVLRTINRRWPGLPVIVMTAYSSDDALDTAYSLGALSVLFKPLKIDHIVNLVTRVAAADAAVLLVEDDRDLRVALVQALLDVPTIVPHAAANAAEARLLAGTVEFGVAIVDARLPDADGISLGEELHARGAAVVYITGHGADVRDSLKTALDDPRMHLLEKPFSPVSLLALIGEVVD
jgi:DNA-binding NtrC family response regulator